MLGLWDAMGSKIGRPTPSWGGPGDSQGKWDLIQEHLEGQVEGWGDAGLRVIC